MSVPHGPRADQNLRVVAVVPLIIDRHDDPAETRHSFTYRDTYVTYGMMRSQTGVGHPELHADGLHQTGRGH